MTYWIELPTQRFEQGCADHDGEGPVRTVTVGSFAISAAPITVSEFSKFVDETRFETEAERAGTGFVGIERVLTEGANWRRPLGFESVAFPEDPVTQVSWFDAHSYCKWARTRLPTEPEWERAARADEQLLGRWQWCADYWAEGIDLNEQRVNPTGPRAGDRRVVRGGGPRLTSRAGLLPDMGATDLGFRVVATR